jgi:membrane-bound serine protease (ClpP class)
MATVIILLVAGAVLILLETILPGGVAGVCGALCIIAAVVLGYMRYGPQTGNLILVGVCLVLLLGAMAWVRYFPGSRVAGLFVSTGQIRSTGQEKPELLNQLGVAHTDLRPSGVAVIDNKRMDVVTEGPMIERGAPVKVVAVDGMRVVVREYDPGEEHQS